MIKKSIFLLLSSSLLSFFIAANLVVPPIYSAQTIPEYTTAPFCNFTPGGAPTGDVSFSSTCVVYENVNGVANGNLTINAGTTVTLHHNLVWYPGYKINVKPGATIFVNSDSKMVQGKICIKDVDQNGYPTVKAVSTNPSEGQTVTSTALTQIDSVFVAKDPYTCDTANFYYPRENFTTLAYVDTGVGTAGQNFATGDNIFLGMGFMINGVTDVNAAAGDIQVPNTKNLIMLPGGVGGKIGIGITNPTASLHVDGTISITKNNKIYLNDPSDPNHYIYSTGNGGNNMYLGEYMTASTGIHLFSTNSNVDRLTVNEAYVTTPNYISINRGDPTLILQDTDGRSSFIHTNSNHFYVLRGAGTNATTWATYNGYWPIDINLENNDITLGGNLSVVGNVNGYPSSSYHIDGVPGDHNIASNTNSSVYANAALEVRELNFAGAQTGAAAEAPRIGFHWSGRVASQIGMGTDGVIRTYDNPGTGYAAFSAGPTTAYGDIHGTGDLILDGNYGKGLVGVYSPTRYQNVFSMGAAYRLAADGSLPGNLYGIAWTHSNIGGESKAGLQHQALFMMNGVTNTAIGSGIWTNGTVTIAGGGSIVAEGTGTIRDGNGGWIRTYGATGWYSNTYGGGWYMADTTWIRSYGSKPVYMNNGFDTGAASGVGGAGQLGGGYMFRVYGSFYAGGSSREYKENIRPLDQELNSARIYDLQPVSYDYKPEWSRFKNRLYGGHEIGFIAEDVAKLIPELALTLEDGKPSNVDYQKLGVLLVAEMKKHQQDIENLKTQNADLEKRLEIVEQKLNQLAK